MCVTIAATKIAVVASAPTTVGTGTSAPRTRTEKGTRYGRSIPGLLKRSLTTASCAAVNATRTPKLKRLARKPTGFVVNAVESRRTIEIVVAATTVSGEWRLRRPRRAEELGPASSPPGPCAEDPQPAVPGAPAPGEGGAPPPAAAGPG